MKRLGWLCIDETIMDVFYERVRFRNMEVRKEIGLNQISLKKGKLLAFLMETDEPCIWDEYEKCWQVIDDFILIELHQPPPAPEEAY